jgi:hypothetical protein
MLLLPRQCTTMRDKVCVIPSQFAVFLRGHPKAFHFPKWAVLTQFWAVLNDKMGGSKISLFGIFYTKVSYPRKIPKKNIPKLSRKLIYLDRFGQFPIIKKSAFLDAKNTISKALQTVQ